jgi:hypothetical protein
MHAVFTLRNQARKHIKSSLLLSTWLIKIRFNVFGTDQAKVLFCPRILFSLTQQVSRKIWKHRISASILTVAHLANSRLPVLN